MIVQDIISEIEKLAPLAYAEDFDNVGLLVGERNTKVKGVLIAHDTLEAVIDEAIEAECNLIISYHPIIFGGLKRITGSNYVERSVLKAIQNGICIYATHTALDNAFHGMNAMICKKIGIENRKVLLPQSDTIKKLVVHVPDDSLEHVRHALFMAGGGTIGNYNHCSFNIEGIGSFKGNQDANPVVGERGRTEWTEETQLHMTYPRHREKAILKALFSSHPYEEVAYEISELDNQNQHIGMGMYGELRKEVSEDEFLKRLKEKFNLQIVRHSKLLGKPIKRIAVLGGSGAFGIAAAKACKANIFITGDLKYHDFFKAEKQIVLADIGHFETEQFTKELLYAFLMEKFPNFAIVLSRENTNPIQYT